MTVRPIDSLKFAKVVSKFRQMLKYHKPYNEQRLKKLAKSGHTVAT